MNNVKDNFAMAVYRVGERGWTGVKRIAALFTRFAVMAGGDAASARYLELIFRGLILTAIGISLLLAEIVVADLTLFLLLSGLRR